MNESSINHNEEVYELSSNTSQVSNKPSMSRFRILKNLSILSFGFFLVFCTTQAQTNLQSTVNSKGNLGVIIVCLIYVSMIVSSLFLPKLIIRKLGCKRSIFLGILTYIPAYSVNFKPSVAAAVPTSIFLGLGAAPMLAAASKYINEISTMYALHSSDSIDIITSRFFGIYFTVYQNSHVWGHLTSYLVLKPSNSHMLRNLTLLEGTEMKLASNFSTDLCGSSYCSGASKNMLPPSAEKWYTLQGIFMGLLLLAALVVGIFLDPLPERKGESEGFFSKAAATVKHLRKTDQILLVPLTICVGMHESFFLADFSKAYVACAWGIYHVGLVFLCMSAVGSVVSYLAGYLVKYVPRIVLMYVAAVASIAVCTVLYLWEPNSDQSVMFFVLAGTWGFSDGIRQTQLTALYGSLFRKDAEAAFSNFRLWHSLGFCIGFAYSPVLCMVPKICTIAGLVVVGTAFYTVVENRKSVSKISESNQ